MESKNWLDYLSSAQHNVYAPNWGKKDDDLGENSNNKCIDHDDGIEEEIKASIISSPTNRAGIFDKYVKDIMIGIVALTVFISFFAVIRAISTSSQNTIDDNSSTVPKSSMGVSSTNEIIAGTYSLSRDKDIFYELEVVSGSDVNKFGTPQNTAAKWIVQEDQLKLHTKSPNLRQRYIMVLLYFSLGGNEWTVSGEESWIRTETMECDWAKITCNKDGYITSISLAKSNLRGKLPYELSELSYLKYLDLHSNHITGTVPVEWNSLVSLSTLYLEFNDLHGSIPDSLCALREITLEFLTTDCADKPPQVSCYCCTNCFSEIEQEGEDGKNVKRKEEITSRLKEMFPTLDLEAENSNGYNALNWILYQDGAKLRENSEFLGQRFLMALMYYSWDGEHWPYTNWLSGSKKECMFPGVSCNDDGYIIGISLVSSELEGPLIEQLSYLEQLEELDLHNNHLQGAIPESLGELSKLKKLLLHQNDLHGDVPNSICLLRASAVLSDFRTDCSGGSPEVTCPCCSQCDSSSETLGANFVQEKEKAQSMFGQDNANQAMGATDANSTLDNDLPQAREENIKSVLHGLLEDRVSIDSCHNDALDWLITNDPLKVSADYPTLIERFILTVLYFCLDGVNWTDHTNWLSNAKECDWGHVTCDEDNHITSLEIASNNLTGNLPIELSYLESIQFLDLSGNHLVGKIPSGLANLNILEKLYLFGNSFEDFMPEELCFLTSNKLKDLRLDCNIPCDCCHEPCGAVRLR